MKKKLWVLILLFATLIIISIIVNKNSNKEVTYLNASYSEETGQITVYATRPSNKYKPYGYESRLRGEKIVLLSNSYAEGDTDVFVFNILGKGEEDFVFYSIDPQFADEKYRHAFELKIVITDDAINLNNKLWRRNQ